MQPCIMQRRIDVLLSIVAMQTDVASVERNPPFSPFFKGINERKLIDYIFKSFSGGVDETEEIQTLLVDHKVG